MASNRSHQQHWQTDSTATPAFPVLPPDTPSNTTSVFPSPVFTSPMPLLTPNSDPEPDVSYIHSNISAQSKRIVLDIIANYLGTKKDSFGVQVGRRLELKSMNVWTKTRGGDLGRIPTRATESQTVFEVTVTKDMCNQFGTLHGACACYIVDPCSMSAIVILGAALGIETTGVSQSMNLIWHEAAKIGTKLRVVSTTLFVEERIRTATVEITDSVTDQPYISAIHSTIHPELHDAPDGSRGRVAKL